MRILVTGANGYLGRGICQVLHEKGHEVIATDLQTKELSEEFKKIDCDLFSVEDPYSYFEKPDKILHLAWRNGFEHNADSHLGELNKHIIFLKNCVNSGISKISVMGTMHEIGFYEGAVDEDTPCRPLNYYGIAKNTLRDYTSLLCKERNIEFQWLRAFYIVDNTSYGSSIFSKISQAVEKGQKQFPFNSGKNLYDFLDFKEFCNKVTSAVSQDYINGVINICSGEPIRLSERVTSYISENNYPIELDYGQFPDRDYDSKAIWGKVDKLDLIIEGQSKLN